MKAPAISRHPGNGGPSRLTLYGHVTDEMVLPSTVCCLPTYYYGMYIHSSMKPSAAEPDILASEHRPESVQPR